MSLTDLSISLDLDSTLICTSSDVDEYRALQLWSNPYNICLRDRVYFIDLIDVVSTPGMGEMTKLWGVFRPHLNSFISFCHRYFKKVLVWSAGQPLYVQAIAEKIYHSLSQETPHSFFPHHIYTYDECISKSDGTIYKPLTKIIEEPSLGKEVSLERILALDDVEETFTFNPFNGVLIPAYKPEFNREGILQDDIALIQLMCWLSIPEVAKASDITRIEKKDIFTTSLEEYKEHFRELGVRNLDPVLLQLLEKNSN